MKLNKKQLGIVILIVICIIMAILIGPIDFFTHGLYYEEYDISQIAEDDKQGQISLETDTYEVEIIPVKEHLNGFSIVLYNQPADNEGELVLTVTDGKGKTIGSTQVDLSKPKEGSWYKTSIDADLKKGKVYKLQISAHDCKYYPSLQTVDDDYLPKETKSGNIILAYSYAQSTFNFQERIMIVLLILACCLLLIGGLITDRKKVFNSLSIGIFLTVILSWNYMHNSMDNANTVDAMGSDYLVTNVINAERDGEYYRTDSEIGYGLGFYDSLPGGYLTDVNWLEGYSRTEPGIILGVNTYTQEVAVAGNIVKFSNGEELKISSVDNDGTYVYIHFDHSGNLIPLKYGNLDDITFYDGNHVELHRGWLVAYISQYGLQGKVFRHLARYMEEDNIISNLCLICSFATALVFVLITMILAQKYNKLLAGCFFVTFWLSPWIVSFSKCTYWVEFTWFIPMLIGLFCAWKIEDRRCRWVSYIACVVSICVKSLCGYEYISVVMMGLIAFMLVDALSLIEKNKEKAILLFRTIIIIGLMALAGFMLAIIIHAKLRGNGDIVEGIESIITRDVFRRTSGGDLNEFDPAYWPSFNASIWETYSMYFKFNTEIITGIRGNLFPLLCIIPLCVFGVEYKKKNLNPVLPIMYVIFFLTSISWFCLGKGHSYIHTFMNFVLWYFGFVQICFYVIVDKLVRLYKRLELERKG